MKPLTSTLLLALMTLMLVGCHNNHEEGSEYADTEMWYTNDVKADVDLFYVVSTNVATAINADGTDTYLALLTDADRTAMRTEMEYIGSHFDHMNTYAPYYHQYTLSSFSQPDSVRDALQQTAATEVCEAFDYYLQHHNQGRPFVLCGFSQGAQHLLTLLRHIDDRTYSRCVGAYMMGYRVTADDAKHPHIRPATDEETPGVTISFNSVSDTSAIWHKLVDGAVTCINPLNWHTDATPATMTVDGVVATVHVDTSSHVLIVDGLQPELYFIAGLKDYCRMGNYHLGDIIFYTPQLAANAAKRAQRLSAK